ncbi:dimeric protein [Streptomyces lincolnensis]|uniref:Dimeric protein n=1 Tax=Streptomyces lincolnensis TaxID=1915 RepID=A0A1B1MC26_STRLN|nr:CBM35 domain-containing protein [Streptomyces lincolnensis]ANS66094.1 dimeric protein [Streptomyces lincolnensis]AXG54142.1 dimeric protein [Streptomyces lincolnensis]QMV08519.1 carbohydrate-binding protein [Streptomyces lincolnensis]
MTSGNNGASTPEDDDPFGYLYADGQANGAQPPSGGYGYPGSVGSVNRARSVGQRQYGQQQPQAAATAPYGQVPQQAPGQPSAHYAAPETFPGGGGGATTQSPQPSYSGGGGRGGPNTKGLLIGAIAVVAAVVIGIGIAMAGGDDNKDAGGGDSSSTPTTSQSSDPTPSNSSSGEAAELPKADTKTMRLEGGTSVATSVKGAQADGGVYVQGFNQVGASVTWSATVPKAGKYTLYTGYSVPGKDATATLTINGTASTTPVGMDNYAKAAEGDYEKGWTKTYNWVQLNKGANTIKLSCEQGNQCDALLDQSWLVNGWVKS